MNYLELVQATAKEAGHNTLNIQSIANQSRLAGMFVTWVAESWIALQNMQRWDFMRKDSAFAMASGQRDYTKAQMGVEDIRSWCDSRDGTAHLLLDFGNGSSSDTRRFDQQDFYDTYDRYTTQTRTPGAFVMRADGSLRFDAYPDTAATVRGQYWRVASHLEEDADEPDMNPDWHRAIVGLALKEYAEYDESPTMMAKGRRIFNGVYERMCIEALPDLVLAPNPLARGRR
ncbi:MAG: hypothetical protein E6R03_07385 [Hyphomicrobiaceae bacterium]|nr:MAG: hypothetical protein E6R03_07385 [Hyphomicrobiaceae bacterium]